MYTYRSFLFRKFLCFILCMVSCLPLTRAHDLPFVPGQLIIMLPQHTLIKDFLQEYNTIGDATTLKTEALSQALPIYLVSQSAFTGRETEMLAKLQQLHTVQAVQLNYLVQKRLLPNDPSFGDQWALNNTGQAGGTADADVDAPEAWNTTTGGRTAAGDTIVVAVVDGGVQLSHPDLLANIWTNYGEIPGNNIDDDGNGYIDDVNGWNAYNNSGTLSQDQHGTHVAGIIGARGNNSTGVSGINWNVKIMNIAGSSGNTATVIAAYSYALQQRRRYNSSNGTQGAFVVAINSSFGVDFGQPASFPIWCAFYDTMGAAGILNVGATANANTNVDVQGDIPTACPSNYLVTVTNSTRTDTKNTAAGYGANSIDLAAPGTSIYSTVTGSSYGNLTGTSMATPMVAGIIGLMYSYPCATIGSLIHQNPAAFALLVKKALLDGTDALPAFATNTVSGGRANARKALDSLSLLCAIPLPLGLTSFDAKNTACDVSLAWKAEPARDVITFTIEGSKDGQRFEELGTVKADMDHKDYSYVVTDARQSYYRLRINTYDASAYTYSPVAAVNLAACGNRKVVIYPNPLSGNQWILEGAGPGQHAYLFDALGKLRWQGDVIHNTEVIPAGNLPAGMYFLELREHAAIIARYKLVRF